MRDNKTVIDHIYTNSPESQANSHILETYFSDHKAICALIVPVETMNYQLQTIRADVQQIFIVSLNVKV